MSSINISNDNFDSSLIGQRQMRLGKLMQLRNIGIDPYPAKAQKDFPNKEIVDNYDTYEGKTVTLTGRLISFRMHGKLIFANISDTSGQIQLYIKQGTLNPTSEATQTIGFDDLHLLDIGDHIQSTGIVTKTKSGEISIESTDIKILSKSIRPLPTELEDKEDRYRRRYLDMAMHPEVRERFVRRSRFWGAIREFMNKEGFVEINIPVLEHVTGGADAKPFVTHYDALDEDFYLRISHELPLKRLLGGGYEKVYDIGMRFRNEGISDEHLPEHVAMEFYWAYADYKQGMEFTKNMLKYVLNEVYGKLEFDIKGHHVNLEDEWIEIQYVDIIMEEFGINVFSSSEEEMLKIVKENGVELSGEINRPRLVDNLWKIIRKKISGPAFLVEVPKLFSPLAKSDADNPIITQRFHTIIAGGELTNAYSELNDPIDQLDRFLEQEAMRDAGDDEAQMLDIDFVEMLEYGMPPAVGFGLSERVFWFFENVTAKEGVPFPQLKHHIDDITKKIYPMIDFSNRDELESDKTNDLVKEPENHKGNPSQE